MIRIGTSGFSYDDWLGPVYPAGLPARDQLAFYAREFSTVELNVTYYRIPDARTVAGWARKTPDEFLFAVKAYQGLTHERAAPDFAGFVSALHPAGRGWQARLRAGAVPLLVSSGPGKPGLSLASA